MDQVFFFTWATPLFGGGDARYCAIVAGALLVGIDAYVSVNVYEVICDSGHFYGDLFA